MAHDIAAAPRRVLPSWAVYLGLPLLLLGIGSLVGFATRPGDWYAGLEKSSLNPPGWVFGTVWPCLYVLMGLAAARIVLMPPSPQRRRALRLFWLQLAVNYPWNFVFFWGHAIGLATLWIAGLTALVAATALAFRPLSRAAAAALLPYLAWLAFAFYLSATIWWKNG